MAEKKQKSITDITGLAESLAESLKEISTCGKSLTLSNLTRTLAGRKDIAVLLERANSRINAPVAESELDHLKSVIEAGEAKRREALRQVSEIQGEFSREKDFYRRLSYTLINLARTPDNETFYRDMDECRSLLQTGSDLESLEGSLRALKDRMFREDIGSSRKKTERILEPESRAGASLMKSFFGRGEKTPEDVLPHIKEEAVAALNDLQAILGEDYRATIHLAREYVTKSRDIDAFLGQKTYVLSLVDSYVQRSIQEKNQVTGFIKEVSERLLEMEREMAASSTASKEAQLDEDTFNSGLEAEIRSFHHSVLGSRDFESLRTFVVSQLSKISMVLQKRREEYATRIEKAQQESEGLKKDFQSLIGQVIDKNRSLMEEIQRDPLTEIYNRRTYEASIAAEFERFQRYRKPFTLIFFDVDNFKSVNDRYGHDAGDRVLKAIARKVREVLRKPDVFARYGGEEFIVILPETELDNGLSVAMKIREMIEETIFEYEGERVGITISVGVTESNAADTEPLQIAQRADRLLYRAKTEGRNRVVSDADGK